jgi:hypothetical protein
MAGADFFAGKYPTDKAKLDTDLISFDAQVM